MKIEYFSFKGFYHDYRYLDKYTKCISNFHSIMSQVPPKIRDTEMPQSSEHVGIIEIDVEDD